MGRQFIIPKAFPTHHNLLPKESSVAHNLQGMIIQIDITPKKIELSVYLDNFIYTLQSIRNEESSYAHAIKNFNDVIKRCIVDGDLQEVRRLFLINSDNINPNEKMPVHIYKDMMFLRTEDLDSYLTTNRLAISESEISKIYQEEVKMKNLTLDRVFANALYNKLSVMYFNR